MTSTKKILVHTCCAACASHVFPQLTKAGFGVIAFFYNPYIDDQDEYKQRLHDLTNYCEESGVDLLAPDHEPSQLLDQIEPYKDKDSIKFISDTDRYQRKRCSLCNGLTIQNTVEQTKKKRLKYFSSTLLCSPYKDHDQIIGFANEKALDYGLTFYYQDFRKGYWMGRNYAKNHQFYLPTFCGCRESLKERRLE